MATPLQFFMAPNGAAGPAVLDGDDGVGGGGSIQVAGKWGGDIVDQESHLSLKLTPFSTAMDTSTLTVRWLSGEGQVFGTGWTSPWLEAQSQDGLPGGMEWMVRAPLDIVPTWGCLPDDPQATCEFRVNLLTPAGNYPLDILGVAKFAHPFDGLIGCDLPHYVCPGMSAVISGGCRVPVMEDPDTSAITPWPGDVGMVIGVPVGSQSLLSFSPSASTPQATIAFPQDKSLWRSPDLASFRQRIYVTGAGTLASGAWGYTNLEAQGTLPGKPLWGPTDLSDVRVTTPEPIVVFNAPDVPMDGTVTSWAVKQGREFGRSFGDAMAPYRLVVPGYRRVRVVAAQTTDAAAGLSLCLYNGANDTQNNSSAVPGDGDEHDYRKWALASDASPVVKVVKPGVYLLLVGTNQTSKSSDPTQEFHGTVAVSLSEAPTPLVYNGVSATGAITTSTESTANHPWGQGDMYEWTPTKDTECDLSMAAAYRMRLIVTDAVGNILGDAGGSSSEPARVRGIQLQAGVTYHIEAGRAWDVNATDLGSGAYTLSSAIA